MKAKQWLAGCLGAVMVLGSLPFAAAAGLTRAQRQEDLDFLAQTLTEKHPNFFASHGEQAFREKKAALEAQLAEGSDWDFVLSLAELAALGGDSHTMLSIGGAADELHRIAMEPEWYDGRWTLTGAPRDCQAYLGQEIAAINGHTMDEVTAALAPLVSHDNEVHLRRQIGGLVCAVEVLAHYGLADSAAAQIPVTVRAADGAETTLSLPVYTQEEMQALAPSALVTAQSLRTAAPATEYDRSVYYKWLDLGGGALYIQYNACRQDPQKPMADFAAEVERELARGGYTKLLLDLRSNGGGSDGVLYPLVYLAQQFMARGGAAYVLAGEGTFSSALINTVQLKDAGAVFVGTPTGGSVDHFGAVTAFTLPNSGLRGQYSNKFIDLGQYYEAAKPYGVQSFVPDVTVEPRFADYLGGVDSAVQYILTHAPMGIAREKTARPSAASLVVDGKTVAAAAYEIEDSNYFKLRDLAMAFAGTRAAFAVDWEDEAQRVTLTEGVYTPVGGELAPLPAGAQTARRATAEVRVDTTPLVGKAYEIGGNHYFKLRDLCFVLGVQVEWDQTAQTIRIDTGKPYLS